MIKRIAFDVILFLSIFLLPWWITAILGLAGIFIFAQFYEFIAVGIIMHSIYVVPGHGFISSPLWFTLIIFIIYISIQFIRRHIILYKNEIPH
ncbi:MAG TPA: hypothetical protein VMR49_03500 [Candidatus Paceibacterota bacterium]|jgi:hypothetical protein|nr:hypothetical protein [Candidatus Paceibacterota bacterium]